MRESPVASEKIAVDQASRRPVAPCSTGPSIGRRLVGSRIRGVRNVGTQSALSRAFLILRIAAGWWVRGAPTSAGPKRTRLSALLPSRPPARRGLFSNAEHQTAEE